MLSDHLNLTVFQTGDFKFLQKLISQCSNLKLNGHSRYGCAEQFQLFSNALRTLSALLTVH